MFYTIPLCMIQINKQTNCTPRAVVLQGPTHVHSNEVVRSLPTIIIINFLKNTQDKCVKCRSNINYRKKKTNT